MVSLGTPGSIARVLRLGTPVFDSVTVSSVKIGRRDTQSWIRCPGNDGQSAVAAGRGCRSSEFNGGRPR